MNEEILNKIPQYINKLPKKVVDFISGEEWEKRVRDICIKYSLTKEQSDDIADNVLLVLVGIEKPDEFESLLVSDLNLSKIISEQIIQDLEKRVFEFAINQISIETHNDNQENNLPEIRPQNLPMKEDGEVAHNNPIQTQKTTPTPPVPENLPIENIEQEQKPQIKISDLVSNVKNSVPPEKPQQTEQENGIKKYVVDPYREPLE